MEEFKIESGWNKKQGFWDELKHYLNSFNNFFFSYEGRFSRIELIATLLLCIFCCMAVRNIGTWLGITTEGLDIKSIESFIFAFIYFLTILIAIYVATVSFIKRLHDINSPGRNVYLVPIKLTLIIKLFCLEGYKGRNYWGGDQLYKKNISKWLKNRKKDEDDNNKI